MKHACTVTIAYRPVEGSSIGIHYPGLSVIGTATRVRPAGKGLYRVWISVTEAERRRVTKKRAKRNRE